jgi:hypothetical protein
MAGWWCQPDSASLADRDLLHNLPPFSIIRGIAHPTPPDADRFTASQVRASRGPPYRTTADASPADIYPERASGLAPEPDGATPEPSSPARWASPAAPGAPPPRVPPPSGRRWPASARPGTARAPRTALVRLPRMTPDSLPFSRYTTKAFHPVPRGTGWNTLSGVLAATKKYGCAV